MAGPSPDAPRPSRRPPTWQLAVAAAAVVVIVVTALIVIASRGDDEPVATTASTATTPETTTSETTAPSTVVDFSAPPPRQRPASTTAAPASTTTIATTTTTTTSTTTPSQTSTTTTSRDRTWARPGPEIETTSGNHGAFRTALAIARDEWRNAKPRNGYVFRTRTICFCPVMDNEITVGADGTVESQRTVDGDPETDPPTIDELFEDLEALVDDDPDRIRARFDTEFGYPVEFFVDPEERLADEEHGREIDWLER